MADEVLDSVEQGERARQWMQQNGSNIIIGILAAIAVLFGYNAWKNNQERARGELSDRYAELVKAVSDKNQVTADALIARLVESGDKTVYASLALLEQARTQTEAGKLLEAVATYEQAAGLSKTDVMKSLALLRKARLQIALDETDAALASLDKVKHFEVEGHELRGDALLAKKDTDGARKAYKQALAATGLGAPNRMFLEQKLDDLGS